MTKLKVCSLPKNDNGRLLVRLNIKYREGIDRYDIAKITNNKNEKFQIVLMLGHDKDDTIFMPFDIRHALGLEKSNELDFTLKKVGFWRRLYWYVSSRDPAVHIPARIAVVGLVLAIVSIIIGFVTIF